VGSVAAPQQTDPDAAHMSPTLRHAKGPGTNSLSPAGTALPSHDGLTRQPAVGMVERSLSTVGAAAAAGGTESPTVTVKRRSPVIQPNTDRGAEDLGSSREVVPNEK
jgi:hypothetical protein